MNDIEAIGACIDAFSQGHSLRKFSICADVKIDNDHYKFAEKVLKTCNQAGLKMNEIGASQGPHDSLLGHTIFPMVLLIPKITESERLCFRISK